MSSSLSTLRSIHRSLALLPPLAYPALGSRERAWRAAAMLQLQANRALRAVFIVLLGFVLYKLVTQHVLAGRLPPR